MIRRLARRVRSTFTGPSSHDLAAAMLQIARLEGEVRGLAQRVAELGATAEPFHTRPGTLDRLIARSVLLDNEYRLPDRFEAGDLVIDVGAHVGSFATACLLRGAGRVIAFEPVPSNHALLSVNLARFGNRAEARPAAVWRSDAPPTLLRVVASPDAANTGGGNVFGGATPAGLSAPALPLDAVIAGALASSGAGRVRMVKVDCEGSEYPVLLTATRLDRVDEICGEYHEVLDPVPAARVGSHVAYGRDTLVGHLSALGFRVTTVTDPVHGGNGLFWARREPPGRPAG